MQGCLTAADVQHADTVDERHLFTGGALAGRHTSPRRFPAAVSPFGSGPPTVGNTMTPVAALQAHSDDEPGNGRHDPGSAGTTSAPWLSDDLISLGIRVDSRVAGALLDCPSAVSGEAAESLRNSQVVAYRCHGRR